MPRMCGRSGAAFHYLIPLMLSNVRVPVTTAVPHSKHPHADRHANACDPRTGVNRSVRSHNFSFSLRGHPAHSG